MDIPPSKNVLEVNIWNVKKNQYSLRETSLLFLGVSHLAKMNRDNEQVKNLKLSGHLKNEMRLIFFYFK